MQAQNRYNAACAAALAGSGQGKDDPPLDNAAKARCCKQAIDWLKADLAAWSKVSESGPSQARQSIPQTLQHWKADSDLAGIRDEAALARLPEDEQKACRALWAELDALLKRATNAKPSFNSHWSVVGPCSRLNRDRSGHHDVAFPCDRSALSGRLSPMEQSSTITALDRMLDPLSDCLNREAAERIVALRIDHAIQARIEELADRSNGGLLTAAERAEY